MDYIKLSKEISYALRHKPEEYNLSLDEEGYVFINDLLNSINSKNHYSKTITIDDIYEVIRISDKKRLDINKTTDYLYHILYKAVYHAFPMFFLDTCNLRKNI